MIVQGVSVPSFFYGTAWKEDHTSALTLQALRAGFRAVDTANQRRHYFEAGVGDALAASGIARDELFLQSKFTYARGQDHRLPYDPAAPTAEQVAQSFASSLEHLRTDRLDAYLLHGPSSASGLDDADRSAWRAFGELRAAGKVRLVGISNVTVEQLETLCRLGDPKPAFVQNRCYARTGWDAEVRALCRAEGIAYQGFSLLTVNQRELAGPVAARIARRMGATIPQVVFRFAISVGMIPLTGSSDPLHLAQDLESERLALGEEDVEALSNMGFSP